MQLSFLLLALLAGATLAAQIGINSSLRVALGSPVLAALVNFMVGLAGLMVFALLTRTSLPGREAVASAPWWAWVGGLLGAFYVTMAALVGQRLGVTALLALTVTGQLVASLVIDQYGLLGMAQQGITLGKIVGAILLMAGMLLVVR
jgi:transporter family-2 protein